MIFIYLFRNLQYSIPSCVRIYSRSTSFHRYWHEYSVHSYCRCDHVRLLFFDNVRRASNFRSRIRICDGYVYWYFIFLNLKVLYLSFNKFLKAGLNCLTTNYVVEIVGSKAFANAFGILSMARGLGSMTGPFLTGLLNFLLLDLKKAWK